MEVQIYTSDPDAVTHQRIREVLEADDFFVGSITINGVTEPPVTVPQDALEAARDLLAPVEEVRHGTIDSEYARAVVEMLIRLTPGANHDDHTPYVASLLGVDPEVLYGSVQARTMGRD